MIMSDTTKSKLLELVAELRSKKSNIEKQFHNEIEKVDNDLKSVQRTLDLLLGEPTRTQPSPQLEFEMVDASQIAKARNQIEILKMVAMQNNNIINATQAADILIRVGRAKGKRRNLVGTIHNALSNSDEWEWVSAGNFKLKNIT